MSLRGKFYLAFSLIATLAIGLAGYGVRALSDTGNLVTRLYDEPLIGVNYARAASTSFNEAHGLMDRAMLLGPGRPEDDIGSLRRAAADTAQDLDIVRERMHERTIVRALDRARAAIDDWFETCITILAPPEAGVTELPMPDAVTRRSDVATRRARRPGGPGRRKPGSPIARAPRPRCTPPASRWRRCPAASSC